MALPKSPMEKHLDNLLAEISQLRDIVETIKDRQAVDPQFADQTCPDCKVKGMFYVNDNKWVNGKQIPISARCVCCREVHDICQGACNDILGDDNRSDQDPEVCQPCMDGGKPKTWADVVGI